MKKSNLKKILALFVSLAIMLPLVACGNGGPKDGDDAEMKSYHIGYNTWGAGNATFDFMATVIEQALTAAGATYTRSSDDHMADKELQNIQNFIAAGVDGIIMQTAADPIFPQAAQECADAKIPFVMSTFTGTDEDRAKVSAENEYYLGTVTSDMYAEGYLMGQEAAKAGHKTALLLGGNVGDAHFEMRIDGFTKAFVEEGGGKILDSARCANPGEGQEKANAMLSAIPDADCLFAMVGDYVPGAVNAMEALGIDDMPIYCSNANTDTIEYLRNGKVVAATAGNDLVGMVSTCLLINYLDGHQIVDADGKAPELTNKGFVVNADNIDDYEEIFKIKEEPFKPETIRQLLWRYNKDVTYEDFENFVPDQLQIDNIVATLNK
ncbi:MAG: sugar ABC transporter substrate-binding protein [Lachnospiraceae bacterium]